MLTNTRYFGTIDLDESKILTFPQGIMGFEDYKRWTLLYDKDTRKDGSISWLQSLDESSLALPVVSPYSLIEQYAPIVNEELLKDLGPFKEEDLLVLLALTVPKDVKQTTANMKAPFLINPNTARGIQIIVENENYPVHFRVYEVIQRMRGGR